VGLFVPLPIDARQRLSKNAIASTNTHATVELLDSFSMRTCVPAGTRSRDDCAGEDQQKMTALHFVLPRTSCKFIGH
jgi:hypothetical protein